MFTEWLLTAMRALRAIFIVSGVACPSLDSRGRGVTWTRGASCGTGTGVVPFAFGGCGALAGGCGVSCATTAPAIAAARINVVRMRLDIVFSF
jgi:hypothetical protein